MLEFQEKFLTEPSCRRIIGRSINILLNLFFKGITLGNGNVKCLHEAKTCKERNKADESKVDENPKQTSQNSQNTRCAGNGFNNVTNERYNFVRKRLRQEVVDLVVV